MELYQLRTFLAVAEEQNLTRAAEKLFTSQPAVSAQIKALEEEVGVRLFDRGTKGMKLTRAGEVLREQARRIVDAARDFKHSAESLRGSVSGELVFGVNNRPEVLRLVEILRSITDEHSDLCFELVNGSSGVVLQGIEDGTISIGFFEGSCESSKIAYHELDQIELCIAAPIAWAAELAKPDWRLLENKPWIFTSPACSYSRFIQRIGQEQGLNLTRRFQVNEDLTVLNLVAEGLGLTITAVDQIKVNGFEDRVVMLPHFRASVPLSIGYLAANEGDPSVAAVRDHVLKVWQKPAHLSLPSEVVPFRSSPAVQRKPRSRS
ncbi:LysR family transcriptional regulator [Haloferula sp. BvORR071]|uniref:LysR family transcriptional regulator n=1 Tax=Haloferula sp. BvORR071 TaxID=1396141 RepID=UPI0006970377|nr:LysR family transcriptional regulator [Haloferula sp. BvORR071]